MTNREKNADNILSRAFPKASFEEDGRFSIARHMAHARSCNEIAEKAARSPGITLVEHRTLILVDLQGLYLALIDWVKARDFPLESGLIISRFAIFLLSSAIDAIKADVMTSIGESAITFEDVADLVSKEKVDNLDNITKIVKIEPRIELFYAPAPLDDIEWQLRKRARSGSWSAREHLDSVRRGVLHLHGTERDYRFYDSFVDCLKHDPFVTRSEQGFFNFYVGSSGLQFIDEKEVDIRIAIRAVDACTEHEVESLCIVSSDQDFVPLHERCSKSGVRTYQADAAKFTTPEKVGRRIRGLGERFIPTEVNPDWPLRAILGAVHPFAVYAISDQEFEGLCQLHNGLNDVKLAPHPLAGGGMGIRMYRPS